MINTTEDMRNLVDKLELIIDSSPVFFYTLPEYVTLRKTFTLACREFEYCDRVKRLIEVSHAVKTPRCVVECGQCHGFGWIKREQPLPAPVPKWVE